MSGAGHVMDMIRRNQQNRALRSGTKNKFKEYRDDTIHSGRRKGFITRRFSKQSVLSAKNRIKQQFKREKKRELIILIAVILMVFVATIYISANLF